MPRTYRRTLAVPDHETNAFGDLRSSSLARFLQQTAIEASTDAGFADAWYREAGTVWIIRRTTIERSAPIRAGDEIELTTWVADFRRVRSRREYVVRAAGTNRPLAAAHTDWVYLDRRNGKLARIPDEMIRGFVPDGDAKGLPREPLAVPDAPEGTPASERTVRFRELDGMLHVNNAVYLDDVEDALFDSLARQGWTPGRCLAEGGFLQATRHDLEYVDEARFGDGLRARAWAAGAAGECFTEIRRAADDALLTRARSRWAWQDAASGATAPFPAGLGAIFGP